MDTDKHWRLGDGQRLPARAARHNPAPPGAGENIARPHVRPIAQTPRKARGSIGKRASPRDAHPLRRNFVAL